MRKQLGEALLTILIFLGAIGVMIVGLEQIDNKEEVKQEEVK